MKKKELLKRGSIAILMSSLMFSLAACEGDQAGSRGSIGNSDPEPTVEETPDISPTPEPAQVPEVTPTVAEEPDTDYEKIFEPILREHYEFLKNGYDPYVDIEYDPKYVSMGVMERIMYGETGELLENIGYFIKDLNNDGVPELMIGENADYDGTGEKSYVYSCFGVKDDEPVLLFEGWARSTNSWLGGDRFYYFGSNGAMSSIFGSFHLNDNGTDIIWEDYYFSDDKPSGGLGLYHNTSGIFDASVSDELNISEDDFWNMRDNYRFVKVPWNAFGDYKAFASSAAGGTNTADDATKAIAGDWYLRSYVDMKVMGLKIFPDGYWLADETFSPMVSGRTDREKVLGGTWEATGGGSDPYAYNMYDENGGLYHQITVFEDEMNEQALSYDSGLTFYKSEDDSDEEYDRVSISYTWLFASGAYISFDDEGNFDLYDYDDNWCLSGKYIFTLGSNGYYLRLHSDAGDAGFSCIADGVYSVDTAGYDKLEMKFIKGLTDFTDGTVELGRKL